MPALDVCRDCGSTGAENVALYPAACLVTCALHAATLCQNGMTWLRTAAAARTNGSLSFCSPEHDLHQAANGYAGVSGFAV